MPEEAIFLTSCTVQIYSTWMDNMLWKDVSHCGFFGSIFTLIHIFVSTLFRTFELNYANYVLQDIPQEMEPLQKDTFYLHFSFSRQNSVLPQTFPIFGEAFAQDHNIDSDCNWRRWRLPASFSFQTSQPLGTQAPLWPPLQEVTVSLSAVGTRGSVSVFLHSCCKLPHHITHSLHSCRGLLSSVCWPPD